MLWEILDVSFRINTGNMEVPDLEVIHTVLVVLTLWFWKNDGGITDEQMRKVPR